MAINKESNGYIIGFATVMVIVVGALLAFIAMALKPAQKSNVQNEKKQYILKAINIDVDRAEAGAEFDKYVKRRIVLNYAGEVISENTGEINSSDEKDAFNIDLLKEYKLHVQPAINKAGGDSKKVKELLSNLPVNYPLFECEKEGKTYYVIPMMGTGLWAAVWGYIGFEDDFNTMYGAVFDHKSETPGLGSEIATDMFRDQFKGKTISEDGSYTSVRVIKPGGALDNHKVDGISGGTFTSVGVDEMIQRTAEVYYNYFQKNKTI